MVLIYRWIDPLIDWFIHSLIVLLINVPSFVREVEPLLKGRIQLLLQNKHILTPSWMNEGRKDGRKTNKLLTDRPNEPRANDWLSGWLMCLALYEKLNPYWKEEFNCSCKTRISWYPLEWRKEGRKTNKIMTERPNEPRTNDWLIEVPSFVREVETLLKGGIQLLLQNKDILVPSRVNAWMKEGRKEGRKTNETPTEGPIEPRGTNDWLYVPSVVREVEPLLKGRIQLLLQSKDILAPNEWIDKGRKTNKIPTERPN